MPTWDDEAQEVEEDPEEGPRQVAGEPGHVGGHEREAAGHTCRVGGRPLRKRSGKKNKIEFENDKPSFKRRPLGMPEGEEKGNGKVGIGKRQAPD